MAFYVSVVDGARSSLLLGPFNTHGAALAHVEPTRRRAVADDPRAHFYAFGTCRHRTARAPGRLNDQLDYTGPGRLP